MHYFNYHFWANVHAGKSGQLSLVAEMILGIHIDDNLTIHVDYIKFNDIW